MSTVKEIADAIRQLTPEEHAELEKLLYGDDDWDRQIKADLEAGKLDKLIAEARAEIDAGTTKPCR